MRLFDIMLDFVFPATCFACGAPKADLCSACLSLAPSAERESAAWIFPLYDYRHPTVKKSLWLLKYKGRKRLVKIFAEALYEKILEELSELGPMENFSDPILMPIPLSQKRRRERGFNQAELLCREIIRIHTLRHSADITSENDVLVKPRETEHQARIKDRRKRLENIKGSFATRNAERIKGKNIILIDDILTTGATLSEAKKVLKASGARKVIAFTVAH